MLNDLSTTNIQGAADHSRWRHLRPTNFSALSAGQRGRLGDDAAFWRTGQHASQRPEHRAHRRVSRRRRSPRWTTTASWRHGMSRFSPRSCADPDRRTGRPRRLGTPVTTDRRFAASGAAKVDALADHADRRDGQHPSQRAEHRQHRRTRRDPDREPDDDGDRRHECRDIRRLGACNASLPRYRPPLQISGLTTTEIGILTTNDVSALTLPQVDALALTQVNALATTQIAALGSTQVNALSIGNIAGLASTQIASLTQAAVSNMSTTNFNVSFSPTPVRRAFTTTQ